MSITDHLPFRFEATSMATSSHRLLLLRERARCGDSHAQAILGFRYSKGIGGLRRDVRLALYWNRRAARAGNPVAQYNLGQAYWEGKGTRRDVQRALSLYQQVWRNEEADASVRASAAVNIGWAAKNVRTRAALGWPSTWYLRAARLGHSSAYYNLGLMALERGARRAAGRWFDLGAALGHRPSRKELRCMAASYRPDGVDAGLSGSWYLDDSDVYFDIYAGEPTRVHAEDIDDGEVLVVSDIHWRGGHLHFTSLCVSTGWRVVNELVRIDARTFLLVRRGDCRQPTIGHWVMDAPA